MSDNKTALDDWCNNPGPRCILPAGMIDSMRNQPSWEEKEKRQQRMIDHGDVDPDYFNR